MGYNYEALLSSPYYQSIIKYVFSSHIREYDISKANINVLKQYGCISDDLYEKLFKAPRDIRQIQIGLLQKSNPEFVKILQEGILKAKETFLNKNNIDPNKVLCIKNDAIFLINTIPEYTKFGLIEFKNKSSFTSYMNIFNVEMYYYLNRVEGIDDITVKGIGKNVELHKEYMIDFISYIFFMIETTDIAEAIQAFQLFYKDYINLNLNIEYYRTFNSDSIFNIINTDYVLTVMKDNIKNKQCLNISYNMNFLREIYGILSNIYFSRI